MSLSSCFSVWGNVRSIGSIAFPAPGFCREAEGTAVFPPRMSELPSGEGLSDLAK
ncbi:hypothetical protein V0288_22190 [Pannus brasiliensis CCIBt3594]|uniref:Uncharacterized protein n=1 Tax=Pannus brasiliensis CCIBt3594 TaxID=1427578 RepID=A0AAW9QWS1_9CHRO